MHVALVAPSEFYEEDLKTKFDSTVYYYGLAKALIKNGIKVTVLCQRRNQVGWMQESSVHGLPIVSFKKPLFYYQYAFNVHQWLLENPDIDVIDSTQHRCALFIEQEIGGTASVVRIESTFLDDLSGGSVIFEKPSRREVWSDHLLSCKSVALADVVLSSTRQHAEFASAYNSRVQNLPPGLDVSELPRLDEIGPKDGSLYIFVDRFEDTRKGGEILPRILQTLRKDRKVVVVGTAREDSPVVLAMQKAHPGVTLELGVLSRSERMQHYSRASYVLSTSKGESFGYTMLEALACGVPVMCFTQNDTTRQTWPLWNIGPWGTQEALSNIPKVIDEIDRQDQSKFIRDAEVLRDRYSWDSLVSEYISVYAKAIAQSLLSGRTRGW